HGKRLRAEGMAGPRERRTRTRDRIAGRGTRSRVPRTPRAGARSACDARVHPFHVAAARGRPAACARHRSGRRRDPRRLARRGSRGRDRRTRLSIARSVDAVVEDLCGDLTRIRAPRGSELHARTWATEAPLRMLLNNLDREVAERPEELVVYGGSGNAARKPEALRAIVRSLRAAGETHFGSPDLSGRTILTAGLGGMGGAQPLAGTMAGAAILCVEVDPARIERRIETRYLDEATDSLDDALERIRSAASDRRPLSIALLGNAADVVPELARRGEHFDLVTDQTAAHDPLNGYVPRGLDVEEAARLRATDQDEYLRRAGESIAAHVRGLLEYVRAGSYV